MSPAKACRSLSRASALPPEPAGPWQLRPRPPSVSSSCTAPAGSVACGGLGPSPRRSSSWDLLLPPLPLQALSQTQAEWHSSGQGGHLSAALNFALSSHWPWLLHRLEVPSMPHFNQGLEEAAQMPSLILGTLSPACYSEMSAFVVWFSQHCSLAILLGEHHPESWAESPQRVEPCISF